MELDGSRVHFDRRLILLLLYECISFVFELEGVLPARLSGALFLLRSFVVFRDQAVGEHFVERILGCKLLELIDLAADRRFLEEEKDPVTGEARNSEFTISF